MANATRFSPSAGWDQVRHWLGQHMQALIALAGVFFVLPSLALSFFGPMAVFPALDPATTSPEIFIAAIEAVIRPLIPWIIILSIIQMAGQLAIMAVAASRNGATVAEAISTGFGRLGYLILAQIVLGVAVAILFLSVSILAALIARAVPALGIVVFLAILVGMIYLSIRFSLVAAVLVAEDARWPLPVLRRSWKLTRGNAGMILLFFLIVAIVFVIISLVANMVFGLVLSFAGAAGLSILAVILAVISAAGTVIFSLMPLAVWQQVTGGTTPEVFS